MRSWLMLVMVTAVVMIAAPSAGAQAVELPVGNANGVRIVQPHGAIVVVFGPTADRLWRRVRGKRVSVMCEKGPDPDPDHSGFFTTEEGGTTFRAPQARATAADRRSHPRDGPVQGVAQPRTVTRHGARRHYGRELIVAIPLTQRGAVRLDERAHAAALLGLMTVAALPQEDGVDRYASSADLVSRVSELKHPLELPLVALSSPSDTPPAGSIGYYSDGAQHAAAIVLVGEWPPAVPRG